MIDRDTVFLVVDDFEPMRKVTSGQLRAMGANTVITANNGSEALHILQNRRVDVVLSDWNMPVMTGLDLLKAVRADARLARLPFIMITAEVARERVEEAIACGVSELLVKPYTSDRLAVRIEKTLTQRPRPNQPAHAASLAAHNTPPQPGHHTEHPAGAEPSRPEILVVDDSPDNLLLLSHLFMNEYSVRIAHTGEKALGICQSNQPPDLVLLDIMMPGMDGFEVARKMREHPTSESIPVIFVTSLIGEDVRLKGLELGAVDFINKPIDPDVLKPRVRNFLRYVELNKQLQADYDGMLEAARLHEDVEYIVRHDMKGPLAGIVGLVQSLEEEGSMSAKHAEQLHMIEETAMQVLDMINLSAELFKIETGRFQLDAKPVKIGDVLRRIGEMARTTFAEKHLVIAIDTDVPVGVEIPQALGDSMFCHSLFQNLIKNACEAAPEHGRVTVTLMDESPLRIMIQNKGAVPAEIRDSFFDKFVTYGKQNGTGLGTYSAKLLAEAQHGEISLAVSDRENMTTLIVSLPRYSGAAELKARRLI